MTNVRVENEEEDSSECKCENLLGFPVSHWKFPKSEFLGSASQIEHEVVRAVLVPMTDDTALSH